MLSLRNKDNLKVLDGVYLIFKKGQFMKAVVTLLVLFVLSPKVMADDLSRLASIAQWQILHEAVRTQTYDALSKEPLGNLQDQINELLISGTSLTTKNVCVVRTGDHKSGVYDCTLNLTVVGSGEKNFLDVRYSVNQSITWLAPDPRARRAMPRVSLTRERVQVRNEESGSQQ